MPRRVLASVIESHGRLLVCRRPADKRHGGLWEFPGGKVRRGESDLEAIRRELAEELGVEVTAVMEPRFSAPDPGSDFVIEFLPVEIRGIPRCLEHTALKWVKEEDLLSLSLAPSDRRYAMFRVGPSQGALEAFRPQVKRWERAWGLPGLSDSVTVEFSRRLRSSFGLCMTKEGRIRLAERLRNGSQDLLEEILCHELAHVAVHRLHGPRARPHGPEWRQLMARAGFVPRARIKEGEEERDTP